MSNELASDPQRFAAALLKLDDVVDQFLHPARDPQRFAAALLKRLSLLP